MIEADPSLDGDQLLEYARQAVSRAYCPANQTPVGAAALTAAGHVFQGCSIHNESDLLSICAERVALFNAVAAGEREIIRVAVSTEGGNVWSARDLLPCGACREVLREFCDEDMEITVDHVGDFLLHALLREAYQF